MDYVSKWVEAEVVATIANRATRKFAKHSIVYRFGIPQVIIYDNDTQFTRKAFKEFSMPYISTIASPLSLIHR